MKDLLPAGDWVIQMHWSDKYRLISGQNQSDENRYHCHHSLYSAQRIRCNYAWDCDHFVTFNRKLGCSPLASDLLNWLGPGSQEKELTFKSKSIVIDYQSLKRCKATCLCIMRDMFWFLFVFFRVTSALQFMILAPPCQRFCPGHFVQSVVGSFWWRWTFFSRSVSVSLSMCGSVMDCWPIQGVAYNLPDDSWGQLLDGRIVIIFSPCRWILPYFLFTASKLSKDKMI